LSLFFNIPSVSSYNYICSSFVFFCFSSSSCFSSLVVHGFVTDLLQLVSSSPLCRFCRKRVGRVYHLHHIRL
jgi:hypothetical protein